MAGNEFGTCASAVCVKLIQQADGKFVLPQEAKKSSLAIKRKISSPVFSSVKNDV